MLTPGARPARPGGAARQRGFSLVELLIGITIGLFVVSAAILGVTTSLSENRMLLLEARLQQDLRAAMDLITRDIRRTGYWANAQSGIWTSGSSTVASNPYAALVLMPTRPTKVASTTPVTATGTASNAVSYSWSADGENDDTVDNGETFNFRLQNGRIQMLISGGTWQEVTDPNTVTVTAFSITPTATWIPLYDECASTCNPTTQNCPELVIRSVNVSITARTPDESTGVRRTLTSTVRLRNDEFTGSCP